MYRVSELVGKPLICASDAQFVGTITNIFFDENFKVGLFVSVSDGETNELLIPFQSIYHLNFDAAVVDTVEIYSPSSFIKSPVNLPAYTSSGKSLGKVRDILMSDGRVCEIITDLNSLEIASVLKIGQIAIFQ